MSETATTGETATLTLDSHNRRAGFAMRGPGWRGGPFTFAIEADGSGFALRVPDAVDPIETRYATWNEAAAAFAEDVQLHVLDVLLAPTEEDERRTRESLGNLSHAQAGRLLAAIGARPPRPRG